MAVSGIICLALGCFLLGFSVGRGYTCCGIHRMIERNMVSNGDLVISDKYVSRQ